MSLAVTPAPNAARPYLTHEILAKKTNFYKLVMQSYERSELLSATALLPILDTRSPPLNLA
jgi:hypothetical protein